MLNWKKLGGNVRCVLTFTVTWTWESRCDSWPVFLLNHMNSKSVKSNISSQLWSWIWLKWAWNPFHSCSILVAMYSEKAAGRLVSKQLLTSKGVSTNSSILVFGQNAKLQGVKIKTGAVTYYSKGDKWVFSERWVIGLVCHHMGTWECLNHLVKTHQHTSYLGGRGPHSAAQQLVNILP